MKLLSRRKILAAAVSAIALVFFLYGRNRPDPDAEAHISVNGERIMTIKLSDAGDGVFSLRGNYGAPVDFEIKEHRIRFINVECPDHICEKTGFVGSKGEAAVCMPNRTSVVIN